MISEWVRKFNWFRQHFYEISYSKKLVSVKEVGVPDVFLGPVTYCEDSLATSNNSGFITEPRFAQAYALARATNPWEGFTSHWRTYIVCWFADLVKNLEGDFVECGVNTGAYSRAVIDYTGFELLDKTFYLLDSFEGMDPGLFTEDEIKRGIRTYLDHYSNVFDEVTRTFAGFNVKIIKGYVPATLKECPASRICYLSIDMNSVVPEIEAMNYFWPKVVKGGVVILDDYGFPMHINQKKAFDEFALQHHQTILSLPTAQGIIIKR